MLLDNPTTIIISISILRHNFICVIVAILITPNQLTHKIIFQCHVLHR